MYFFNQSEVGRGGARFDVPAPVTEFPLFVRRPLSPPPGPLPCTPRTWAPAQPGFLASGNDVIPPANLSLADAQARCASTSGCTGITFAASAASPPGVIQDVYFKGEYDETDAAGWWSYAYCAPATG